MDNFNPMGMDPESLAKLQEMAKMAADRQQLEQGISDTGPVDLEGTAVAKAGNLYNELPAKQLPLEGPESDLFKRISEVMQRKGKANQIGLPE